MENNRNIQDMISSAESRTQKIYVCMQIYKMAEISDQPGAVLSEFAESAKKPWFANKQERREDEIEELLSEMESGAVEKKENLAEKSIEEIVSDSDIPFYLSKYKKLVVGLADYYSMQGYGKSDYYQKLWSAFSAIIGVAEDVEKGVALFLLLQDMRTPYYDLGVGVRMSNEQYKEISQAMSSQIEKILFAFSLTNSQRTELASRILVVFDEVKTREEKVVLLSHLITIANQLGFKSNRRV